ncbi:hypothetical protein CPC08DRAFT_759768 [Agrocybe pediades]|nr:hypothetical protein CPC08DRAFT_759768 [Agrocybe pediades]
MLLLPNGEVLIVNGGQTGYATFNAVQKDPVGNQSDANYPANKDMPTTNIARLCHSVASLTPLGNILIAGSNPNGEIVNGTKFATEFRVEYPKFPIHAYGKTSHVQHPH